MKKYDLLVFDFDGTLVDTVGDIAYYANWTLKEYGYAGTHDVSRVKKAIGLGVHELLKDLEPMIAQSPEQLEIAAEYFKKGYRERPVRITEAFASARQMLDGPLASVKKAIVTNKPQDITERILRELKMDHYFQMLIGMHAGFAPKPDPAGLLHVIKALGSTPDTTIFVGDSSVDAATSLNAHVDFAWVSYGYDEIKPGNARWSLHSADQWKKLVGA